MMSPFNRREFLSGLGKTGALLAAGPWLRLIGYAQAAEPPRACSFSDRARAPTSIAACSGAFLEHLGRAVYTGVFEPGSPLADGKGFRTDVAREMKELGVPVVRYPGGNFVSGYNWLDGVGPKADRPVVLERAWNSIETNQFGTNEFIDWCRVVGTEPLLGMNFGTGTAEMAVAYVEYCNVARGTKWSDLRRAHGYAEPHNVRYWCLGNEMDGPWQIGQMQAREYGRKARDVAQQMRVIDRDLKLLACGSSGTFMPTYLTWDREVLEECYDQVDGISLHAYYGNTSALTGNSSARYLAMNLDMDRHIHETAAVCDYVQGLKRSSKRLWLSFDEWNVWYRARGRDATDGRRTQAPKLLEEVYNLEDALLVGGLINTLLRNSDRVHVGLPRAARERDCAARDQRQRRAPAKHILPVRVGAPLRAGARVRFPRRVRDVSDYRGWIAGGLRPQRGRAVRRRPRHARRQERSGVRADAESRSRDRTRSGDRVAGGHTHARAHMPDAYRTRPESVQHVRCTSTRRAAAADAPCGRQPYVVQAAAAFVQRRPSEH